jgi:hypothetical protein
VTRPCVNDEGEKNTLLSLWAQKKRVPHEEAPPFVEGDLVTARTAVAVASAAVASAAEGTASAATLGTLLAGACLVDVQVAALEFLALKGINGGLALVGTAHRDEAEAARTAGLPVGHDEDVGGVAILPEEFAQILVIGIEGEISYVEFHGVVFVGDEIPLIRAVPGNRVSNHH